MLRILKVSTGILFFLGAFAVGLAQKDPLQGRWEGKVKSQRGELPAKVMFRKEGAGYSGIISGPIPNSEMTLKEVKLDGDKVSTKADVGTPQGTVVANIKFTLKGENLKGKGQVDLGNQVFDFDYDFKRVSEDAGAPAAAISPAPTKPQVGQGSQEELDAFKKLQAEVDPGAKKGLIEDFLKKHPESGLVPYVHREASIHAMQTNNFEMMAEYGEKALAAVPEDFALMTELGRAYGERGMVDKAEEKAEHAIEMIASAKKPDQVTDEQWDQGKKMMLATNFSTLGYVHVRRAQPIQDPEKRKAEAERAIAPFKKAIEINNKDDVSYWRLGFAYIFLNDYDNAESNLARSVVLNGVASSYARKDLEELYKKKHKSSLEGLDKVLTKTKGELGLP